MFWMYVQKKNPSWTRSCDLPFRIRTKTTRNLHQRYVFNSTFIRNNALYYIRVHWWRYLHSLGSINTLWKLKNNIAWSPMKRRNARTVLTYLSRCRRYPILKFFRNWKRNSSRPFGLLYSRCIAQRCDTSLRHHVRDDYEFTFKGTLRNAMQYDEYDVITAPNKRIILVLIF